MRDERGDGVGASFSPFILAVVLPVPLVRAA